MEKEKKKKIDIKSEFWPKTKKGIGIAINSTKKVIDSGEQYIKKLSLQGINKTKEISLSLKREKLYYKLGRLIIVTPNHEWLDNEGIARLISQIRKIDQDLKKE